MTPPHLRAYPLRLIFLGFLLLVASCASTKKATVSVDEAHPEIERLLLLPVQKGQAGVDEVVRNLQRRYGAGYATGLSTRTNAGKPITLEDGAVIAQALTGTRTLAPAWDEVAFDLEAHPCVRIERALALTGATKAGETTGSDTVRANVTYQFQNSDVRIDITAYAPNPQCVGTVWIYKAATSKAP
ncbi:hypothetical protein [Lysobacter sp. CA199]|uniref:hypothetical protein n=1 Tax=Lysobacter sp. CA199 TaxID=3455608 RepID=UPI003F8D8627